MALSEIRPEAQDFAQKLKARLGTPPPLPEGDIPSMVRATARRHGLDEDLFDRLIRQESRYRPDVVSNKGAQGLGQLMPETAASLGVKDPFNPAENLEGSATLLKGLLEKYQEPAMALAAYNAGEPAVDRYGGIPPYPETQNYVQAIMGGAENAPPAPEAAGNTERAQAFLLRLKERLARPSGTFGRHAVAETSPAPRVIDRSGAGVSEAGYRLLRAPERIGEAIESIPTPPGPPTFGKHIAASATRLATGLPLLPLQVAAGVEQGVKGGQGFGEAASRALVDAALTPAKETYRYAEQAGLIHPGEKSGPLAREALGREFYERPVESAANVAMTVGMAAGALEGMKLIDAHRQGLVGDAALEEFFGRERAHEIRNGIDVAPPSPAGIPAEAAPPAAPGADINVRSQVSEPSLLPEEAVGNRAALQKQVYADLEAQGIGGRKSKAVRTRSQMTEEIASDLEKRGFVPGEKEPVPGFVTEREPVETTGTEAGAMGRPARKAAPATFLGEQEMPAGRSPVELYNLTEDIPGHTKGSTVSRQTLEKAGFSIERRGSRVQAPPGTRELEFTETGELKPGALKNGDILWTDRGEMKTGKYEGQAPGPAGSVLLKVRDQEGQVRHFQVREGETRVMVRPKAEPGEMGAPARAEPIPEAAAEPTPSKPPATGGPPVGPHDVRDYLEKRLLVPIRKGMHQGLGKKFLGIYKTRAGVARVADVMDLPTIAHEVGHHLEQKLGLGQASLDPGMKAELVAAGRKLYAGRPQPKNGYASEGVAEFHSFLLTDPARAASEFPTYSAEFTRRMQAHPEAWETLQEARRMIERWRSQPHTAQALAHMSIGKPRTLPMTWERMKAGMVDDMAALERVGREMERENPGLKTEAYDRTMAHRVSAGIAEEMLERRMFDSGGNTTGPSFRQIIAPVRNLDDLRVYLLAQATKERLPLGKQTGLTLAQAEGALHELAGKPDFNTLERAAEGLYRFKDQFLQYLVDEGLVTPEAAAAMRATYQKHAPLYRDLPLATSAGRQGPGGLMGRIKRAHGGTERIIDPLESIAKDVVENVNAASRNRVRLALLKDARAAKGSGRFVEPDMPIPMEALRPVIEDTLQQLKEKGIEIDTEGIPEDVLASRLLMFHRAPWRYHGRAYTVAMEAGKPKFMAIHDEPLFRAMEMLDRENPGTLVKALNYPVRILKAGVVEYNPAFGLANFLVDQWTLAANTKRGAIAFIDPARAIGDILGDSKVYQDYRAQGLEGATFNRFGRNLGQEVLSRATGRPSVVMAPFRAAQRFNQILETASRLAEFKRAKAAGASSLQAMREAQEATVNFNRIGHAGRALNMISAFYNPGLQGTLRFFRAVKENPARVAATGAGAALASAILYSLNADDPEYQKLQDWRKDRYWHIPTGTGPRHGWIVIKKPRVLGFLFGSNTEQVMDFMKKRDPKGFVRVQNQLLQELLPGTGGAPLPNALIVPVEWWANKSLWTGQATVPMGRERMVPEQQFRSTTGPTARTLAKGGAKVGVPFSPAKLEQAVRGATGGFGVDTMRLADIVGRKTGAFPETLPGEQKGSPFAPEKLPLVSRFFYRRPADDNAMADNDRQLRREGEVLLTSWRDLLRTGTKADQEAFRRKYGPKLLGYLARKKELDKAAKAGKKKAKPITIQDVRRRLEAR